ncbi:hypothetical protein ACQPZX_38375 [Actinoplanes sp. CA-142083]|uniref:hypothetical protein n=1 Tax=Actinoplanes sp. CA-142083 TaxID=3239903 RepID=UPI003D9106CE
MSRRSGKEVEVHLPAVKLFAAATGTVAESLFGLAGANDFIESSAGAAFAVGTENVLGGWLSRREQWNAETVVRRAVERAAERCAGGESPREDDFIAGTPSSFEELVEGTLGTAQRNYESRKLEYLGNLVASFAFDASMDRTTANWCIRMAESLSWAQYVLLALASEDESKYPRASINAGRDRTVDDSTVFSVWEDFEDLHARRLIGADPDRLGEGAIPRRMIYIPMHGGGLLIRLMELHTITADDRDLIYSALLRGTAPES